MIQARSVYIPSGMCRSVAGIVPTGLSHSVGMRPFGGRLHSYGMPVLWGIRRFYRAMHPDGMQAQLLHRPQGIYPNV